MMHNMTDSRFELKYRIDYFQYLKIRNSLYPYMVKDQYTKAAKGKGYLVRSLYFDTDDFKLYYEKMDGNNKRIKFRIRAYTQNPCSPIRVELKMREGNIVIKKNVFAAWEQYCSFMKNRHWESDNPVLIEFERHIFMQTLRPQILIDYSREGYEARDRSGLRITFDHKVRSTHANTLYADHFFFREHNPFSVVMEIKFRELFSCWLKELVHQHGLKVIANSKYTQAIQAARHNLYHPDGIVVLR